MKAKVIAKIGGQFVLLRKNKLHFSISDHYYNCDKQDEVKYKVGDEVSDLYVDFNEDAGDYFGVEISVAMFCKIFKALIPEISINDVYDIQEEMTKRFDPKNVKRR